jgi:uncharacterized membrane protein YbhN (UPF0104 family)
MKVWLRVAVSVGLLALLLLILPWDAVKSAIQRLPLSVWLSVLAGFIAGHLLGVVKWRMLVSAGGRPLRMLDAVRCYAAGLFANLCLPSIVGGDILRAALAAKSTGSTEAAVLGGVVDRAIDVATLGILIAVGGLFARDVLPGWGSAALKIALVTAVVLMVVFLPLLIRRPLARWPHRFRRRIGRGQAALRSLARRPGAALTALVLSVIIQSLFVILNAWVGQSVGIGIPIAVWFLVWPLAKVAGLLPISLGGLAVRDATFAALLVPVGVPMALGVVASLIWQSVLIVGGLLAGILWWVITSRTRSTSPGLEPQDLATTTPGRQHA